MNWMFLMKLNQEEPLFLIFHFAFDFPSKQYHVCLSSVDNISNLFLINLIYLEVTWSILRSLVNGEEIIAFIKLFIEITTLSPVYLFAIRGRPKIALGTRLERLEISSIHFQISDFYLKITYQYGKSHPHTFAYTFNCSFEHFKCPWKIRV